MNYRPFPRPKCPEGLCIFYSFPLPRVNVQTTYRFQSFLSQYVSLLDTKSPGAGQTPSVKPCGFATSLSEGGNPLRHRCAMPPPPKGGGLLHLTGRRKAPSLRGLSPQATGGVCPKRKKAPEGGPAAALRGKKVRSFLLVGVPDLECHCNVAVSAVRPDNNAKLCPAAIALHVNICSGQFLADFFLNLLQDLINN